MNFTQSCRTYYPKFRLFICVDSCVSPHPVGFLPKNSVKVEKYTCEFRPSMSNDS